MMTVTDEERDRVAALIPQPMGRQLVARLICLALGFGAARAAKDIAAYGADLTRMAFGSPSDVPAIAWPGEWRRAKRAVAQAQAVVEVSSEWYDLTGERPQDDDEAGPTIDEAGSVCGVRFPDDLGGWHSCTQDGPAAAEFHMHSTSRFPENAFAVGRRRALWVEDGEPHHEVVTHSEMLAQQDAHQEPELEEPTAPAAEE